MRRFTTLLCVLAALPACQDYAYKGSDDAPQPYDTGEPFTPPVDTASAPDIVVSPAAVDLGEVDAYTVLHATLVVSNVGSADLHIAAATSAWDAAPALTGTTLAPGASVTVELSTTAEVGDQTATYDVQSDDADAPLVSTPLRYTGLDDPCSWSHWRPDDGCDGGWTGTGTDGEATLTTWNPLTTALTDAVSGTVAHVADETGFRVDDEVFLYDAASGAWAFARVVGLAPLTLGDAVTFPAGSVVQRVPHYTDVTVDGDVDGARVVFRACGTVTVRGHLGARGGGWAGGARTTGIPELGWQGQSEAGPGAQSTAANGTAGGGGGASCNVHTDGGGGGHATAGTQGGSDSGYPCVGVAGYGGGTVGEPTLAALYYGGAGGSGYLDTDATAGSYGGAGGGGGGLVRIVAEGFVGEGVIEADGGAGQDGYWIGGASPGGGGGGAGGSVWLTGPVDTALSAVGGQGGEGSEAGSGITRGGAGGEGRIRVDGALRGAATPAAYLGCE